jgi:hypothetical protein
MPGDRSGGLQGEHDRVTFSPHKPIPDDLVTRLAQASSKHVDG